MARNDEVNDVTEERDRRIRKELEKDCNDPCHFFGPSPPKNYKDKDNVTLNIERSIYQYLSLWNRLRGLP